MTADVPEVEATTAAPDTAAARSRLRVWLRRTAIVVAAVFVAMQLVPYGWHHSNPPVVLDAPWPSERSEAIARQSCYACHSNETDWPIYSYVAPMSWLVRRDVDRGRDKLNFSRWDDDSGDADDAAKVVLDGAMPPSQYTVLHPGAKLTDDEIGVLVAALEQMDTSGRGDGQNDDHGSDGEELDEE